jgi:hypothetical protein
VQKAIQTMKTAERLLTTSRFMSAVDATVLKWRFLEPRSTNG